ncbi:hypothetical protein BGHDH14_bgh04831 [Blumeria hordei DH14]|uniref:Uncharacterized protein n=1 Tax=Blumeria graminis f. sp. hordei (strain DH14) TaxID=546991 RepID=N1J5M0_BLUG1|nr:hypothetical protein BGHDH14_bgh04831 [Blumeria hordei DH14]
MSDFETGGSRTSSKGKNRVTAEPSPSPALHAHPAHADLRPMLNSAGDEIQPPSDNGPTSTSPAGVGTKVPSAEASLPHTQSPKIPSGPTASAHDPLHAEPSAKEARENAPIERPPFAPFFTLISTGETTVHPRQVHYLFSDDEASEVLTSVLLRSLNQEVPMPVSSPTDLESSSHEIERESEVSSGSSNAASLDAYALKTGEAGDSLESEAEQVVIVDVDASGTGVVGVSSLSSKWQVLDAHIERAPTWNATGEANAGSPDDILSNLMLKIEATTNSEDAGADTISHGMPAGVGLAGYSGNTPKVERSSNCEEEMHALLGEFDEKMLMMRRVIRAHSALGSRDGPNRGAPYN